LKLPKDLTGMKFGRLTVLCRAEDRVYKDGRKRIAWNCRCDCGNTKEVLGENLKSGYTKSCGCLQKEKAAMAQLKHGEADSRLYNVWSAIKRRCFNSTVPEYHRYGGRGITMCNEWLDYEVFSNWARANGYRDDAPRGECTIDRIDNNGDYCPDNCRWVNQQDQMNNVSYNHYVTYNGENHTVAEWSRIYNIPYTRLLQRLNRYKMTPEKALSK